MKLRILVVAAGFMMLPAIAGAQDSTAKAADTTAKAKAADTTAKMADTTAKMADTTAKMAEPAPPTAEPAPPTAEPAPPMAEPAATTTSRGADCPKGCPTSKGAAGLSGVQFLALQQELRDRGCGNTHVTGRLDAATRAAIRKCAKQLNVANTAAAVLVALNIGFGEADIVKPS